MSKVIRISEEIFTRLQEISEPLVDTPASAIARLLDHYSGTLPEKVEVNNMGSLISINAQGLFLAPASQENIHATLLNAKPIEFARDYLSPEEFETMKNALSGKDSFHSWAMTKNSRSRFDAMLIGDMVLFTSKGSGKFSYSATVVHKVENLHLGEALWSVVPGLPWELIYFLDNVQRINIPKEKLIRILGYNPGYVVPGIIRVDPPRIVKALGKNTNLTDLLKTLE
jgi:hypothetical protein